MRFRRSLVTWTAALLVNAAAATAAATDTLPCLNAIPSEWINDGYCDCPAGKGGGTDEPLTGACSGSEAWPGTQAERGDERSSSPFFTCPQQSSLQLPMSRIHDGICDCCDGTDEPEGICPDLCDQVLKQEREARAKLEEAFRVGHEKRNKELDAFQKLRQEKITDIKKLEEQLSSLNLEATLQKTNEIKLQYLEHRQKVVSDLTSSSDATQLLAGFTEQELKSILSLTCQVAGEIMSQDEISNSKEGHPMTCVALRLSGLELGWTWAEEDQYEQLNAMKVKQTESSKSGWADRLFSNAAYQERKWKLRGDETNNNNRRRLDEITDDYDDEDYYGHDDYLPEDEDYDYDYVPPTKRKQKKVSLDDLSGNEKDVVDAIQGLPFSAMRVAFWKRSKEIATHIDDLLAPKTKEDDKTSGDGADTDSSKKVDPAAYNMVKSKLQKREDSIVQGYRWGASASLFLSANPELTEEQLRQLLLYTIYHGRISSVQLWQILQVTVNELLVPSGGDNSNDRTCASPWATSCPPRSITRRSVNIPSTLLVESAELFCSHTTEAAMQVCGANMVDDNGIPTSIPDGYMGYTLPVVRDDKDRLSKMFAPLDALKVDKEGVEKLEDEKQKLEREKKSLEKKVTDMWKDIGGKDGDAMGPNGELHSLANECFDVEAGKYTYEVCIFGDATQKEGSNAGGTKLGKFNNMEYDEETGARTLYWKNGQKCWNGPTRSATVHLTCGAENKLLSADEPDTCRYVLEMESYISCDETYKRRMGL